MEDAFNNKLIKDLETSGFYAEMQVLRGFVQRQWTCDGTTAYFDRDQKQTREIDGVGFHHVRHEVGSGLWAASWFYVVVEVKRSDRPWVVFRQPLSSSPLPPMDAWQNLAICDGPREIRTELAPALSFSSLLCDLGWLGHGVHEAFKNPDKPSRWYAAFVAAAKAAHEVLRRHARHHKSANDEGAIRFPAHFHFVQPVVILDGRLLSAQLDHEGEVLINETPHAPFEFQFRSRRYQRPSYRVDLVRLDHFAGYLERCEKRQRHIFDRFCELLREAIGA